MADDFVYTECPSCGAGVYDNRSKNAERVAKGEKPMPIFKCKSDCGWIKWPPRPAGQSRGGFSKTPAGPKWESYDALAECFRKCAAIAVPVVANIAEKKGVEPMLSDYLSATATVFIAASRDGVKPQAEKAAGGVS